MRKALRLGRAAAVAFIGASLMAAPLVGCSGSGDGASTGGDSGAAESQEAEQQAQSDYAVTIDGSTVTTDYEGNPAIIVDYTFTNNSDDATSFAAACYPQAFQNGVQLETAIVTDDLGNGYYAEIKPGATTSARIAYSLSDESDVTVEVSELIFLDDTLLAEATFSVA